MEQQQILQDLLLGPVPVHRAVLELAAESLPELQVLLPLLLLEFEQLRLHLLLHIGLHDVEGPSVLQGLPGDVQRQILGVHHPFDKGEVVGNHLPALVHDEHPGGVELKALLVVLGVVIEGSVGGDEDQGLVLHLALGGDVDGAQRLLPVPKLLPVELVVLLLLHPAPLPLPQGHHGIEGLDLRVGLVLRLVVLPGVLRAGLHVGVAHLHADGGVDVIGVLLHQLLEPAGLQIFAVLLLLGVRLQVKNDLGAHALLPAALHRVAVGSVAFPLPGFLRPIGPGADSDRIGHHEGGVKAHAELADDVGVLGVLSQLLLELVGAGGGDDAQVVLQVLLVHADAVVGDGDGARLLVSLQGDLKILALDAHLVVGKGLVGQLVHRVAGVGDQLPEEDLLVGVDGVDHQIEQPLGFRFELLLCHDFLPPYMIILSKTNISTPGIGVLIYDSPSYAIFQGSSRKIYKFGLYGPHIGFRFRLSLSTIQASRFSRPACVLASRYALV